MLCIQLLSLESLLSELFLYYIEVRTSVFVSIILLLYFKILTASLVLWSACLTTDHEVAGFDPRHFHKF